MDTFVALPTDNSSTSDETAVLLGTRMAACSYQLQRHFDRQLWEARVLTSLVRSCLRVCAQSSYSFFTRSPSVDMKVSFRVHLFDTKSIYRHPSA